MESLEEMGGGGERRKMIRRSRRRHVRRTREPAGHCDCHDSGGLLFLKIKMAAAAQLRLSYSPLCTIYPSHEIFWRHGGVIPGATRKHTGCQFDELNKANRSIKLKELLPLIAS